MHEVQDKNNRYIMQHLFQWWLYNILEVTQYFEGAYKIESHAIV